MISKEEISSWLTDLEKLIVDVNICLRNLKRLKEDRTQTEKQIKELGFFQLHWFQLMFIICIQLSKLFSTKPTQKKSFIKLLNRLNNEKFDKDLKSQLADNVNLEPHRFRSRKDIKLEVGNLKDKISLLEPEIKKVELLRDKVYAHLDSQTYTEITIAELEKLVLLSGEIHNILKSKLFGSTTMFEWAFYWNVGDIIHQLDICKQKLFK